MLNLNCLVIVMGKILKGLSSVFKAIKRVLSVGFNKIKKGFSIIFKAVKRFFIKPLMIVLKKIFNVLKLIIFYLIVKPILFLYNYKSSFEIFSTISFVLSVEPVSTTIISYPVLLKDLRQFSIFFSSFLQIIQIDNIFTILHYFLYHHIVLYSAV